MTRSYFKYDSERLLYDLNSMHICMFSVETPLNKGRSSKNLLLLLAPLQSDCVYCSSLYMMHCILGSSSLFAFTASQARDPWHYFMHLHALLLTALPGFAQNWKSFIVVKISKEALHSCSMISLIWVAQIGGPYGRTEFGTCFSISNT